MADASW
jgi:hypothetical protein